MNVSELGEFPLIDRLVGRLPRSGPDVRVGPGDDVAAIDLGAGRWLLATTDVHVAGVHFFPERSEPRRLGQRCVAVNLSDIAAAGGRPLHLLVSLILPRETPVAFVDEIYGGIADECGRHGVDVLGGNVSAGPTLTIDVTLLGEVEAHAMLRRDGARPGDLVVVTGELGAAAAGLILARGASLDFAPAPAPAEEARRAFETPTARVREGRALVRTGGATAAIDLSDGLAADLSHVCDGSKVGVRIDAGALPVSTAAREVARAARLDPLDLVLSGGEDYELLFTARADRVQALVDAIRRCGTRATVIGEIVDAAAGRSVRRAEGDRPLDRRGFVHFGGGQVSGSGLGV